MPNTLNCPSAVVSASTLCSPTADRSLPILDVSGSGTAASGMDMNAYSAPHHAARYPTSAGPRRLLKLECDGGVTTASKPYTRGGYASAHLEASAMTTHATPAIVPANRAKSRVSRSGIRVTMGAARAGCPAVSPNLAPSASSSDPSSSSSLGSLRSDSPASEDDSPRSSGSSRSSSTASASAELRCRQGGHRNPALTPAVAFAPPLLGVSLSSDSVPSPPVAGRSSRRSVVPPPPPLGRSAPAAQRHQNRPATLSAWAYSKKLTHPDELEPPST